MKDIKKKLLKSVIIILISAVVFMAVTIFLISPLLKSLLEKYDTKYTGRQITAGWTYINPITGYIHIRDLKIYELSTYPGIKKKDSVFFSARGISLNIALRKLLSKTVEITRFTLDNPVGIIIQDKNSFNFSDILEKFTSKKKGSSPSPYHFNILNVDIRNGEFHYHEKVIPIDYSIKKVNIETKGMYWNVDTVPIKFSFSSGVGSGDILGNFIVNLKNNDYRLAIVIKKLDLNIIDQYLKDLVNFGKMRAILDARLYSAGNLKDAEKVTNKGTLVIYDFHFGKKPGDDYVSFDQLALVINNMSPKNHIYDYDSISIRHPYIIYERYQYLDNIQRIFGKKGSNISKARADPAKFNLILKIADYIKVIARNFFKSNFKINKVAIYNGLIKFNDFSLTEKFAIETSRLSFVADSIDRTRKRVPISFKTGIKPYGNILVKLNINPKDSGDFDLHYHFQNFPAAMFNPYLISYTSFPLDGGTIELSGDWNVVNGKINSRNHLLVIDPRVSMRLKNEDTKWLPTPLIMALVREQGNVIDYEIPITGNLKDPKFHLKDVVTDVLGNIFIKPARIPYISHVKYLENEIEKSLTIQWYMRNNTLMPIQEKFVDNMVQFLAKNPEATIEIYPIQYIQKEKEYILFFEAKKKYFLQSGGKNAPLSTEDSLKLDNMSINDSAFVRYVNKKVSDSLEFTMQEKCRRFVGSQVINKKFRQLSEQREEAFLTPFRKKGVVDRVKIFDAENDIPYNGFSYYKIVYKGDLPENLIKAYKDMNDLNNRQPRKRFRKERSRTRSIFGLFGKKQPQ